MTRFAYLGNFQPEHSTENELRKAIGAAGQTVDCYQENEPGSFTRLVDKVDAYDVVLWTRTGWQPPVPPQEQYALLLAAERAGVPTVGYHLDRWWGLHREHQVHSEPFFRCSVLFTADGGHQAEFAAAGINHAWLPPAVSEFECEPGTPRDEYRSELAFVGSWRPGYHAEWTHRPELIQWLQDTYGNRVRFWPRAGEPAVRGEALRDLYASVDIVVGDSCLAGGATHYWSDRVPETIGRGGFLLHPQVDGIREHFTNREHLALWRHGDWEALRSLIDQYLTDGDERRRVAEAGRAHVLANHTYTVRVRQVLDHLGLA